MFKSFRTKFASVKNDVAASLKGVSRYSSARHDRDEAPGAALDGHEVLNASYSDTTVSKEHNEAAQDALHRYEETWEEFYVSTKVNLKKAKVIAKDLHSVQTTVLTCGRKIAEFENEVKELPSMLTRIQEITDQIVDLHGQCALIEDSLVVLENLCEEAEMEKAMCKENQKVLVHESRKAKQLADYSAKLSKDNRNKLVALELRETEVRRKKELFYQNAFEEDMQRFKVEQSVKQAKGGLQNLTIDPDNDDVQKLEDFLNDDLSREGEPAGVADNSPDLVQKHVHDDTGDVEAGKDNEEDVMETGDESVTQIEPFGDDDGMDQPVVVLRERSDTDQSARHTVSSNSSLEWDDNGDKIDIIAAKGLESSLEAEIDGIISGEVLGDKEGTPAHDRDRENALTSEATG